MSHENVQPPELPSFTDWQQVERCAVLLEAGATILPKIPFEVAKKLIDDQPKLVEALCTTPVPPDDPVGRDPS